MESVKENIYKYKVSIKDYRKTLLLSKAILCRIIQYVNMSKQRLVRIDVQVLVEPDYIKYLLTIFRSNKEFASEYQFIYDEYLVNEEIIERVLLEQLEALSIDGKKCFESVNMIRKNCGFCQYCFMCSREFYVACHERKVKFDLGDFS